MSASDDPNTPLPRMEKDAALKWAKDYIAYMAQLTDVELIPSTAKTHFEACVGESDEVAKDGRYSLFYYVRSPRVADKKHTQVVQTLHRELPKHDYKILGYREFKNSYYSALIQARNKKNSYYVEAHTVGSDNSKPQRLSFSVRTPCMLPPGVKQQQF